MNKTSFFRVAWSLVKLYALPVIAAGVMYKGILQILEGLRYPLTDLTLQLANAIFLRAVRDHLPLINEYGGVPWQYYAKILAEGLILSILGMFIGLWANMKHLRPTTP